MYQKYNAVLRACTGDAYLVECARKICKGNQYATTIHAINSAVIKLSKLTRAGKVYRGVCYGKLPNQFWKADPASGVKGGIEFGFQSTTRERAQAVHYARGGGFAKEGDAMTVMEFQMGMIDRGAGAVPRFDPGGSLRPSSPPDCHHDRRPPAVGWPLTKRPHDLPLPPLSPAHQASARSPPPPPLSPQTSHGSLSTRMRRKCCSRH